MENILSMLASQVLEIIRKEYIPGCIQYWQNQSVDQWQAVHDEWELTFSNRDKAIEAQNNKKFLGAVRQLIWQYKNSKAGPSQYFLVDSFVAPKNELVTQAASAKLKECSGCGGTVGLKIVRGKIGYFFKCEICGADTK
jgi:hypothetical protein